MGHQKQKPENDSFIGIRCVGAGRRLKHAERCSFPGLEFVSAALQEFFSGVFLVVACAALWWCVQTCWSSLLMWTTRGVFPNSGPQGPVSCMSCNFFVLGILLTTFIFYSFNNLNVQVPQLSPLRESVHKPMNPCKTCSKAIKKAIKRYAEPWKEDEYYLQKFKFQVSSECHGFEKAIITQANTPLESTIFYDREKKTIKVTPTLFKIFPKEHPFSNKTWDTCSVVGNGGILINSTCGKQIDSAEFVIRCNLPPLGNGFEKHVGRKTNFVTANPSIMTKLFNALNGNRRPFVERLQAFGNSMLLLPTYNSPECLRAVYTIQDFDSPIRPISFNPEYLQRLHNFWRSRGLKERRLSTGLIMVSLALELCAHVDLYGFWPFSVNPYDLHFLTHHYYDSMPPNRALHAMPAEFDHLLRLHSQGVLRIHLGECQPGEG